MTRNFNRTIVELKFSFVAWSPFSAANFNRTIVELKCGICWDWRLACRHFNRTIVELKSATWKRFNSPASILIEP